MSETNPTEDLLARLVELLVPRVTARILSGADAPKVPDDEKAGRRYVHELPPPRPLPPDDELHVIRSPEQVVIAPCPHPTAPRAYRFMVHGTPIVMRDSIVQCAECLQRLLDATSERCAECGKPIVLGMHVALAWIGAPHPYTHANNECSPNQALMCGQWGVGVLMRLHEVGQGIPEGTVTMESIMAAQLAEAVAAIIKARAAQGVPPVGGETAQAVADAIAPDPPAAAPDEGSSERSDADPAPADDKPQVIN